ncbi:uncharacterized protein DUF3987 [Modicisalibacter xianhensis]|uniref:Uncharacterized protein DUF3987 n=1 Tax=Modicisalibacter xianhensis TaxID=442341 RepID=A0A4R8FJ21_9GAMM|nr:YfjI family protein [Halomonas xianhensis]TDX22947.1 uncharacterized protein DUF3987 [Halomonas xianhensis]
MSFSSEGSSASRLALPEPSEEWPHYQEGSLFQSAVIEASSRLQVPRPMAMTVALGAMSAACQTLVNIKQPLDHYVQASLMLLSIADSGERKTTVEKRFFKALRDWQHEMQTKAEEDEEKYLHEQEIWKIEDAALKAELKRLTKKNHPSDAIKERLEEHRNHRPRPPRHHKLLYDDTTPQALIQLMYRHSASACLVTSEANSIFSGRALGEIHHLNTLWDGGDIIVDRVTSPSILLANPRLTLSLMAQPSVIHSFLSKRGEEARGMGFLARFLVVRPQKMAGKRATQAIGDLPHLDAFNQRIRALLDETTNGTPPHRIIEFTADAADQWRVYHQQIENEMAPDRLYTHHTEHASKLMDNVSRVAGILHTFEGKDEAISLETLNFAYLLCLRYSRDFLDNLAGEPAIVTHTNLLVDFLLDEYDANPGHFLPDTQYADGLTLRSGRQIDFVLSRIKQYGPYPLRNNSNRNAAIDLLIRMGHVEQRHNRYRFSESILTSSPVIKNGETYTLRSLPLYHEQYYFKPSRTNLHVRSRYMIIVPVDNGIA